MKILWILLLFSLPLQAAHAAPVDFLPALNVLYGVQTRHITSTIDGQKYSWFKTDIRFGDGSVLRYCLLMDMARIQQLPALPNLYPVNGYYTNAGNIDPVDDAWCQQ
jgi:hypothetical protein